MARKQSDDEPYRNFDEFMAVEDALCDDVEVFDLPFSGFKWKVHSTVKSNPSGLETRGREPWLGERFTYSSLERTSGNAKASCEHIPTHDTLYTHYARQLQMGKLVVRAHRALPPPSVFNSGPLTHVLPREQKQKRHEVFEQSNGPPRRIRNGPRKSDTQELFYLPFSQKVRGGTLLTACLWSCSSLLPFLTLLLCLWTANHIGQHRECSLDMENQ